MNQRDIKLLWGRAGALCSLCKVRLAHDKEHATGAYHIGEQAHIVDESPDGPRGRSILTCEQREAYHNRILLCPNCHTEIDSGNPEAYPVERLHLIKTEHELWVQARLSAASEREEACTQIYANLVDVTVEGADLDNWDRWLSNALSAYQFWDAAKPARIQSYREQVIRAVWPRTLPELEQAIDTLSLALHQAKESFLLHHVEDNHHRLMAERFYKIRRFSQEEYSSRLEAFEQWQHRCYAWLFEACKAANWFADVVRRDINPMFWATKGRFQVIVEQNLAYVPLVLTYSDDEKAARPKTLEARALRERRARRV